MPAWLCVRALNCLQNSMMLTPWGPSAVPTGGAGFAAPAGHCSFTIAVTFLAIKRSWVRLAPAAMTRAVAGAGSVPAQLHVIHLHRRRPPEEADRDLHLPLVRQHFLDGSAEIAERPLGDLDDLAHQERNLFLRLRLGGLLGDAEQPVHLVGAQRLRRLAGADELDHALDAVDQVERFLGHAHLDQDVAGVQLALDRDLLAVLDLDHFLDGHERLAHQLLVHRARIVRDPLHQEVPYLVLVTCGRLDRVPAIVHAVTARSARRRPPGASGGRSRAGRWSCRARPTG